jgi:erythromycin esterase-like protein
LVVLQSPPLDNLLGRNGTQDVQEGKPFQTIPQEMADAKVIAFGEAKHGDGAQVCR